MNLNHQAAPQIADHMIRPSPLLQMILSIITLFWLSKTSIAAYLFFQNRCSLKMKSSQQVAKRVNADSEFIQIGAS